MHCDWRIFFLCAMIAPSSANFYDETLLQMKKWMNAAHYVESTFESVFADHNTKLQAKLEAQGYSFDNRCLKQAKEYCNNIKMISYRRPQNHQEKYNFELNLERCKEANKCAADRIEEQFNEQKTMAGHSAIVGTLKYAMAGVAAISVYKSPLGDYFNGGRVKDILDNHWTVIAGLAGGVVVVEQYDEWIKNMNWLMGKRNEILDQVHAYGVEIKGGEYILKKWDEIIEEYIENHKLIEFY